MHGPEILVLDEPFSGLDPVAVGVMSEVLRDRAAAGVPVIFSSHQLELVERLCDRVGIVRSGRLVAQGTIDELRATDRPLWEISGSLPAGWEAGVAAVTVTQEGPGAWRVEAASAEAAQAGLAAAMKSGTVTSFAPVRPSLTELFQDVVSAPEEAA
ncbi:hypothetical protein GCM10025876_24960 [Demequina litorisediminis]|uniref:Daunorubicin resistance ATP-binding protein DrrA1/2-like C-terminal domain-containing protein n=1 Tax=Demequina litorisediminis TaxID=1849022 RepID=A0ABQ6IHR8_9MICO|nr:hypothetical protein GCM10025876_24960 [Demequina litorisediminis]